MSWSWSGSGGGGGQGTGTADAQGTCVVESGTVFSFVGVTGATSGAVAAFSWEG